MAKEGRVGSGLVLGLHSTTLDLYDVTNLGSLTF